MIKKKEIKNVLGVLLISFCICLILFGLYKSKRLLNNRILVNGARVNGYTGGGKFHAGSYFIDFSFYLNKRKFTGSSIVNYKQLPYQNFKKHILGKSFPVVFDQTDTSNNTILILPSTFSYYDYNYPDSLKWVLKYIND